MLMRYMTGAHPQTVSWFAILAATMVAGCAATARAQEGSDDEPYRQGLVAAFRDASGTTATRVDHLLSFHWPDGPPDPRLAGGEFRATWRGHLYAQTAGDYRFSVFGSGEVELTVAGKVAVTRRRFTNEWAESPPVRLDADFQPVELSFRRTGADARLVVLWSGPDFGPEPVPPRLLFHRREQSPGNEFERGQLLARVLRCGRCHGGDDPPPAPALDRLAGNLSRQWLVDWLAAGEHAAPTPAQPPSPRRMPALGMSPAQAEAVADWLLAPRETDRPMPAPPHASTPRRPESKAKAKAQPKERRAANAKARPAPPTGEHLFLTLGCLACHTWRDLGASGWPGGGDLTHVADKRPLDFFAAWLADPAALNRDHRMPVFQLSDQERTALAGFLAAQKSDGRAPDFAARGSTDRHAAGRAVVEQFRCGACHALPGAGDNVQSAPAPRGLSGQSAWGQSCLGAPDPAKHRPGYRLNEKDSQAVRRYYTTRRPVPKGQPAQPDGRLLLADHNCLACHVREAESEGTPLLPPLLADKLAAVAGRYPDLAPAVPSLTPPALTSVGDKLTDDALAAAIARRDPTHRPYLQVRMPRFTFRDGELHALVQHLVAADRVPDRSASAAGPVGRSQQDRYSLAGGRLVSGDGFGCTSCHQVGSVLPPPAPPGALGPDLAGLGRRIRRPWFDRWVRNPARIVPRMEMPSVQVPVPGVLGDRLDDQLAAVWHVLNLPGFEPPLPNPVRILRHTGADPGAAPIVVTDVLRPGGQLLVKPFLVGLANRHAALFDLGTARLAHWAVGDTARQRTKGKTWFWEPAGAAVFDPGLTGPDLALVADGKELPGRPLGQFVTEADGWEIDGAALSLHYRLQFDASAAEGAKTLTVHVRRRLAPLANGFAQEVSVGPLPAGAAVRLSLMSPQAAERATPSADGRTVHLGDPFGSRIVLSEPASATVTDDRTGLLVTPDDSGTARVVLHYLPNIPVDRYVPPPVAAEARPAEPVEVAPGFTGERLPLPVEIMPTGLAWRPDGRFVFSSLRGEVFEAADTDGDGREDRLTRLVDGLPAPYGVHAGADYVDVSAKYAVLRLRDGGRRVEAVASGWGYTDDYHDWAVGLPRNGRGEYFLGIPCQQDQRSVAAARFHGTVLRLVPRPPTADDPRLFAPEPVSAGHRFPMGLALDRTGELFVTDNQGNYNPFNELNHVRPGAHFGFINALDKGKPAPPLTPPAIDVPHPWTRSVNGICFLDHSAFGPFEGHLVGCEYDTRRLVRLSLQRVGDTYQGAAYPLSAPPADPARGFLGPVVCAVSPRGELYVGSIRDSGWGAGNNIGEVVRVRVEPEKLPCGIAEVRAVRGGFLIDFVKPVDRDPAGRADSYTVQSYRRESTPAYGGPDRDRRTEKLTAIEIAADSRRVTLRLGELRPGFVYEFRLKNLTPGGGEFHPAEAHYTLRVVPE
jgi:glucose/arabinose dehydrogenase